MKTMRSLKDNNEGSAVPLVVFILTVIGCGALYTLFFIEVGFPTFDSYVPASDSKTFIMMIIYAIPLFVLLTGIFALFINGLRQDVYAGR